jgi:hypothetical protein
MITKWSVGLAGDRSALEMFAEVFSGGRVRVVKEEEAFLLVTDEFMRFKDSTQVMLYAERLLERFMGVVRLHGGYYNDVRVESAVWTDESGRTGGIASTVHITGGCISTATAERLRHLAEKRTIGGRQITREAIILDLIAREPTIQALVAHATGWKSGWPGWDDLWRVYEIVLEVCGREIPEQKGRKEKLERNIIERGWLTGEQIVTFASSAHFFRHGAGKRKSKNQPITLPIAASWIAELVARYFEHCMQGAGEE